MVTPVSNSANRVSVNSPAAVVVLTIGLLLALLLLWVGRVIFMLLFAAIVLAVLLTAVIDWLTNRFRLRRGLAFALILGGASTAAVLAIWIIGPRVIDQFVDLQTDLPRAANQLIARLNSYSWGSWLLDQLSGYAQPADSIRYAVTRIGGFVVSTATMLAGLVLVAFLGFYMAAEPELYLSFIRRAIPRRHREKVEACAANAVITLRWWLLSQMLSMASVGATVTIGLWLLGVPLAITLGIIAALLTFIPNIGPIVSVVPAALLAFAISPLKGLLAIFLFMLVHFLEGNIITPLLERRIVSLPPAVVMTAQLLLAVIAGPLGVALAAPLTAVSLGVLHVLLPVEDTRSGVPLSPPAK